MIEFGFWLTRFNWIVLLRISDVNLKITYFFSLIWLMIDKFFPLIKVSIADDDKEWITPEIKQLISERQKAHLSNNTDLYKHLVKKVRQEIRKAKINYNTHKAETFTNSSTKEWYQHITKIINNGKRSNIVLNNIPDLIEKSMEEIVTRVNNHFAVICQTYSPYNGTEPSFDPEECKIEFISERHTYKLLKKFSKKSLGPNDFPKQIMVEFAAELALPFCNIANCALQSGTFPEAFKISEIVPIPKVNPPKTLKDLRPISKTPIGGKIIERMIISEIEHDTKESLIDPTQFGNTKGSSTTHYLIKLTNEAFKSTDKGFATSAITIDYSKAFDLVDHTTLIKKLEELRVRRRVIKLIISFLNNRKHYTKINGVKSELVDITCGVPQGTLSGPKLFTILIKGVICNMVSNYKFVDDKTLAHSFSEDPSEFLQMVLNLEATGTTKNKMVINEDKCNLITFNFSTSNIEPKNLRLNGNLLNSVSKITLLGVIITDDLQWKENTANICQKVNRKFFLLWKLKQFGLKQKELLTAWKVLLRPITEYAAPLWHSGLTKCNSEKLERLQKRAVGLILGTTYIDYVRHYNVNSGYATYEAALRYLEIPKLADRRESLTKTFAIDTYKNELHEGFFEKKTQCQTKCKI